ncbi:protein UNUSUAL FLORAL ORGANS-like [Tasmannia lanceolata]|uniref:protein UNUSUAL FLORAL ORGANS-like n=1 Tax=Tasmannia lanceolata TaxID=3420 RepID=UPI0040641C67
MKPILISVPSFSRQTPSNLKIGRFRYQKEAANEKEENSDERVKWKIGRFLYQKEESNEVEEMDERIWNRIPEDMMIRVLSSLPITVILRSTLLSKSFKSIISSSYFLKLNSELSPNTHQPWLLFINRNLADSFLAYDPCLNKWIDLSFRFLQFLVRPITAGDGLICLLYGTQSSFGLCICNPISKSFNIIPLPVIPFCQFYTFSGLFVDRITGIFRLVLFVIRPISVGPEQFLLFTEVYDSQTQLWTLVKRFPVSRPLNPSKTISNGVMYCILKRFPVSIAAFNIQTMEWVMLEAPVPHSVTLVRLMDHNGMLVMIGGFRTELLIDEIGIWELDNSSKNWKRIGWIPKEVCDLFLMSATRSLSCIGHGDLIYFTTMGCPFLIMYDISRKHLKVIDPSPRLSDPQYHGSQGFCFEPRLSH